MLDFNSEDLTPHEETFTIGPRSFLIREADEAAIVKWRNSQVKASKLDQATGRIIIGEVADSDPLLISLCLFEKTEKDGKETLSPVPLSVITKWPNRVTKKILDRIKEISELNEDDTEEGLTKRLAALSEKLLQLRTKRENLKNEQDGGKDTSD